LTRARRAICGLQVIGAEMDCLMVCEHLHGLPLSSFT
jgi:hypothetical protein